MSPAPDIAGRIALHGGGEFHRGDEPFLRAILAAAVPFARSRAARAAVTASVTTTVARDAPGGQRDEPDPAAVRVMIVPAAAAGERPELAVAGGIAAIERVARAAGIAAYIEGVMIVDTRSAASARLAACLAGADLVYLPGGDPGHLVATLHGSLAWRAVLAAHRQGALVAGASAGAMVLAPWTWTPRGGEPGLGLVPGLVVVTHAGRVAVGGWTGTHAERLPAAAGRLGRLGLAERTGILSGDPVPGGRAWRVIGEGAVHWSAPGERTIRTLHPGDTLVLPG